MYTLADVKTLHLEITNKCQASCPMCARNLQGGVTSPFLNESEITIDQFKNWFDVDFIKQLTKIIMCGNLGDPIIAKDTLAIYRYCRDINPNITLSLNTNGSARNKNFWEELANINVNVRFGIDGLEDTHHLYRIGTNFNNIIKNASYFISAGGTAIWDMLVFDHNKHQVELCKDLSIKMGFKEFYSKNTARFRDNKLEVLDKIGKKIYVLYPTEKSLNISKQTATVQGPINCKAKQNKEIYVSSIGIVTPCCWIDKAEMAPINPSRIDYLTKIEKYYSLHEYSLQEIVNELFNKISKTWDNEPLLECAKQCGSVDRFNKQFE